MRLKIAKLKQNIIYIKPVCFKSSNSGYILEEIKEIIAKESKSNIILDLTGLNMLTAVKVGTIAATYHFVEFITGKIYLIVNDKQAQKSIETLKLDNAVIIYNTSDLVLENIA